MIIKPGWQTVAPPHFSDAQIESIQGVAVGNSGDVDDYLRVAVVSCAQEIERYSGGLWWRSAAGDGARACVTRAMIEDFNADYTSYASPGPRCYPAVPDYPRTAVDDAQTAVERWDPAAREWAALALVAAPIGWEPAMPLAAGDMIRITATATPAASAPAAVDEALRRLVGYRDQFRPRKGGPEDTGAPHFGAALRKSGAEEALSAAGYRDVVSM